jgi:hypothetical protein
MAKMFMEKMHAFGNLLQDEWQVFTTPETHLPKIPLERINKHFCHTPDGGILTCEVQHTIENSLNFGKVCTF